MSLQRPWTMITLKQTREKAPWTTQNTPNAMLREIDCATRADKPIQRKAIEIEVTKHQTDEPLKFKPTNVVLDWKQLGLALNTGIVTPEKYPVSKLYRI